MSLEIRDIASPSEFAAMARVKLKAFKESPLTGTIFAQVTDEAKLQWLELREKLDMSDVSQRIRGVYETSAEGSSLVAYILWYIPLSRDGDNINDQKPETDAPISDPVAPKKSEFGLPPLPDGTNFALSTQMRQSIKDMRDKHNDPDSEYAVASLCTHPSYAGRGCASMLLNSVHAEADAAGAPTFVQATDMARSLYIKHGYKQIDKVDFDLEKFGGIGSTSMTVMKRPPKQETK